MNHNEDETCIDLQNRLYTLIETGYIKETEQQLQQLIEENYKLHNKENDKQLINGLSTSEARYVKQIAELQHQRDVLQDELDEKNFIMNEIQSKMEKFELLQQKCFILYRLFLYSLHPQCHFIYGFPKICHNFGAISNPLLSI